MEKPFFATIPETEELLQWWGQQSQPDYLNVNGHIHTPHSFSAFRSVEQPFEMAKQEGIGVLGINDFYTTDGYGEFAGLAEKYKVFPLFNIEFMALQQKEQEAGIRVNDPNNPGRTYFSGKGLSFPISMSNESLAKMKTVQDESNRQTCQMVGKLNAFLLSENINLHFDAAQLQKELAKKLFRERHIAQAVRLAVYDKTSDTTERKELLKKLFSGKEIKSPLDNFAAVENEIRGNLLKSGGPAFVEEDPNAFLSLDEVSDLIVDAGGIPCYPVLLDDAKGNFTDFEADKEKMLQSFIEKNISCIELIPGRNDYLILKEFVSYFHSKGFVVTFGTEHNTPEMIPLKISCRGGVPLDGELLRINYEGAAVVAAHQYLKSRGLEGYLHGKVAKRSQQSEFITLGEAVINWFIQH